MWPRPLARSAQRPAYGALDHSPCRPSVAMADCVISVVMGKLRALLLASALMMAACGGGAVLSSTKDKPASVAGSVQVNGGANAGSDLDNVDVNRVNPSVKKGQGTNPPPAPIQPQTVTPAAPAGAAVATDRCGTGFGSGSGASNRFVPQAGKQPPLPMCALQ